MSTVDNLYISGITDGVEIDHIIGAGASGYEAQYAFDNNLYSYFKPSAGGTQIIQLDLGTANPDTIDNFAIALRNYNSPYSSGQIIVTACSLSDFSSGVVTMGNTTWNNSGAPLYFPFSSPTSATKRYWRIGINNTSVIPISGFYLLKKIEMPVGPRLPINASTSFREARHETPGGHTWVVARNRRAVEEVTYRWYLTAAQYGTLWGAFNLNYGGSYPVVIDDGSAALYLWQMVSPLPKITEHHDFIATEMTFRRMPLPAHGYGY
jgi:hypothetical protein